jgi:hypothetical protein
MLVPPLLAVAGLAGATRASSSTSIPPPTWSLSAWGGTRMGRDYGIDDRPAVLRDVADRVQAAGT